MRTLLIDADSFGYHYAFRHSDTFDWGDGDTSVVSDPGLAKRELKARLAFLKKRLHADEVVIALTDYDTPCFRKAIYKGYKKNRNSKPELLFELREFMQEHYKCYVRPGLEADDVVGILATHPKLFKGEKIVVSIDKDLRGIPCTLYNPDKDDMGMVKIGPTHADRFFLAQVLTGDPVDTYPGCPGIGPKKAEQILGDETDIAEMWELIVMAYENAGLSEKDALEQARVARILRYTDYDFDKKRPKLWKPPKK